MLTDEQIDEFVELGKRQSLHPVREFVALGIFEKSLDIIRQLREENKELQKKLNLKIAHLSGVNDESYRKKIEELEAELDKHRWIPVEERPPEEGKKLLLLNITYKFFIIYTGQWIKDKQEYWYCDTESGIVKKDTITHWKPIILPEDEK